MSARAAFTWILAINVVLAIGDVFAKKAVAAADRNNVATAIALALWIVGCCMWLPTLRARGFTRLIALADVVGLAMVATVGYFFLDERLRTREWTGLCFSVVAVFLLGGAE